MDGTDPNDFILTRYARDLIRYKAHQLCRRGDFHKTEPDDLQQELWLLLLSAIDHFDPDKASLDTYLDRVLTTGVAMLIRSRQTQKSLHGLRVVSLDALRRSECDTPESLAQSVSQDDLARRTECVEQDEVARREEAEAIAMALERMPEELRDVCRRLMGGTVTSVARDLGISRRQVHNRLVSARPYFEKVGLSTDNSGQRDSRPHT